MKAKFSKLLDRAEDPGETLDYSYEKQLELLQNVKRGVADVVTAKKRLQLQARSSSRAWSSSTRRPARRSPPAATTSPARRWSGSRPAAAAAVPRRADQQLEQQQEKLDRQREAADGQGRGLPHRKGGSRPVLGAEAQVKIGEAATGIGEQMADTGLAIQREKDKTEQMQARAGAIDELSTRARRDFTSDPTQLDRELGASPRSRRSTRSSSR